MAKNKLQKFAQMETFSNVFQCGAQDAQKRETLKQMAGCWRSAYFHNENPIVLELGCGRGEYTVQLAQLFPDKNFIGVDIKGARMWAGAKQALETQLTNVAFLRTNIELMNDFFAHAEVDELWITFPDPQMKKATKRLTSSFFLQRYQDILKDNGIVNLKTDSPFLYNYASALVELNKLVVDFQTDDLYASQFVDPIRNIKTHYEEQWLSRGMTIKYIRFFLPSQVDWQEPTEEFERDTYRSYGRNQRSQN